MSMMPTPTEFVKGIFLLLSIVLVGWNYFLRDTITIPILSSLSSIIVYVLAGILFVIAFIIYMKR